MQGLLELGKKLFECEEKKSKVFDEAYLYMDSISNSHMRSIEDQIRKNCYLFDLLSGWRTEEKLSNDILFLNLKKEYQKFDEARFSYLRQIECYKNCYPNVRRWAVYQFTEPYPNALNVQAEYNIKLKNWKSFLEYFRLFGYPYRKIKVLSKLEERTIKKPIYIEKRGVIRRYK